MPYALTKAWVRPRGLANDWTVLDIAQVDLNVIFERYQRVVLELTHTQLPGTKYLDLAQVRGLIGTYIGTRTLGSWLQQNGNQSLPTTDTNPADLKNHPVLYSNAVLAGYKVKRVDRNRHHETVLLESEKPDLLLQKPGIDFRIWGSYLLATVNGFVHRVGGAAEGLYVVDGGRSSLLANEVQVGLLSFKDVGSFETYPITKDMVYKTDPSRQRYSEFARIRLPVSVRGKTPILVIGGYLHVLDNAYTIAGDRSIRINTNRLQLVERFYDSLGQIDLSKLGLDDTAKNSTQFSTADLLSDRSILEYLTLPQSFVILLDTPNVYVKRKRAEATKFPGRYITELNTPRLPMIGNMGRLLEHRTLDHRYRKLIYTREHYNFEKLFSTTPHQIVSLSVDQSNYSYRPNWISQADFLEFGRYS